MSPLGRRKGCTTHSQAQTERYEQIEPFEDQGHQQAYVRFWPEADLR